MPPQGTLMVNGRAPTILKHSARSRQIKRSECPAILGLHGIWITTAQWDCLRAIVVAASSTSALRAPRSTPWKHPTENSLEVKRILKSGSYQAAETAYSARTNGCVARPGWKSLCGHSRRPPIAIVPPQQRRSGRHRLCEPLQTGITPARLELPMGEFLMG